MLAETFEQSLQVLHGRHAYLEHRARTAAQLVDLDDLRQVVRGRGLQQAPSKPAPHLHECRQRQVGLCRIDPGLVAGDHPGLLKAACPFGRRWG